MEISCRVCSSDNLFEMINLGRQPIAHRLLTTPNDQEKKYPIAIYFCKDCGLVQISEPIDAKELYCDYNYCFSSWKEEPHMDDEADIILKHAQEGEFILEVGCNDGKFLQLMREKGAQFLIGVEPNPFASKIARERGFEVSTDLLNEKLCVQIVNKFGKFKTVVVREVLEHILDMKQFFKCIDILLEQDGYLFIDTPDSEIALSMGDCSILWEEHPSFFTESVIRNILLRFGFEPTFVSRYNFSGGIMMILAKRTASIVNNQCTKEIEGKLLAFSEKVGNYGKRLVNILKRFRNKGYKIILYGVGCRACTIVNALNLGEHLDFAIDDQLERQNKYMPASKLPIRNPQEVTNYSQPFVCLLAVNQENENKVKSRLQDIVNKPVEFISLFSPNDIWRELKNAENILSNNG